MKMIRQQSIINPLTSSFIHQPQQRVSFNLHSNNHHQSSLNSSNLLNKSHNPPKNYKYVKYDTEAGNTELVDQLKASELEKGFSYVKVRLEDDWRVVLGEGINWSKDLESLKSVINSKEKVVFRSLRRLYEKNYRPDFFEWVEETQNTGFKYYTHQIPQCLYQMDHLSHIHTKYLFLTQNYSENGLYQVIVNEDGRFKLVTVNDLVPVFDESNEHLWGIEEPWKMILLKVWACLNGGYDSILKTYKPFHFLEYFTSSNWRYYNLQREGFRWANKFKDTLDICYIVLQTKNTPQVQKIGLAPGSTAYNVVNITNDPKRGVQIEVKSRFKHKWKGKLNVVNSNTKLTKKEHNQFRLQKNFILTKEEFFQTFCCSYVISLSRSQSHITDYLQIDIPRNTKKAVYLKFSVKKEGFMDFSFIQSQKNRIPLQSNTSKIDIENYHKQTQRVSQSSNSRFLRSKYMLIKCLKGETKPFESQLSKIGKKQQSKLTSKSKYEAYEVEYLKGYNKGEGHFLKMEPGEYYLRLKSETVNKDAVYYFNYCCSEKLQISEEIILKDDREEILQNCMLSLLPASSIYKTKACIISSGNKFDDMGYGFIVIENVSHRQKDPRKVLFEVDLQLLEKEGYKIKGDKFKNRIAERIIVVEVKPEGYVVLVFKRVDESPERKYVWPPKSVSLFKAKDLEQTKK